MPPAGPAALAVAVMLAAACSTPLPERNRPAATATYGSPKPVVIEGYQGDAMEPFLSRDGTVLFFNDSNAPDAQTDLHWAIRNGDLTFRYRGKVSGANGPSLDAVASMTTDGRLCLISTRSYFETLGSVYCGHWQNGAVTGLALQRRASPRKLGRLIFDFEQSARGDLAVASDGAFSGGVVPDSADLRLARWDGGSYRLAPEEDQRLAAVNSGDLEYAAALSADGTVLTFTRASRSGPFLKTSVWISRMAPDGTFAVPQRIAAIDGEAVEAPSFSPDGRAIYYHGKTAGRYRIWRVSQ